LFSVQTKCKENYLVRVLKSVACVTMLSESFAAHNMHRKKSKSQSQDRSIQPTLNQLLNRSIH